MEELKAIYAQRDKLENNFEKAEKLCAEFSKKSNFRNDSEEFKEAYKKFIEAKKELQEFESKNSHILSAQRK